MEETTLPEFHKIFTINHHIALIQSGVETVISKWVIVYVKVGQNLFQSGRLLPSGAKCFFKIGQLFQSGKIISKSIALQSCDLEKSKT